MDREIFENGFPNEKFYNSKKKHAEKEKFGLGQRVPKSEENNMTGWLPLSIEQVDKAFKAIQNQLHAVLLKTSEDFEYAVEAEFSMPVLEENKAASDTSALQETDSSVTVSECEVTEEKA